MPSNLGKSSKGGKPATEEVKKKKGSFLGIISALLEKKKKKSPDVAIFFMAEYCPRWRRKNWQAEKEIPGVLRQRRRGAARRGGSQNLAALCWGRGSHYFRGRNDTVPHPPPPREVLRRRIGLRDPRRPSPPPLPVLADPSTWSDCGAFKTFACCTCSALCVLL